MLGAVGTRTLRRWRHRQAIARVTVSALVASLPLLYVSLLRPPPAALAGDTAFWFLMSNCVIAAIVATADDAGALFFGSSNDDHRPCDDDNAVVPLAVDDDSAVVTIKGGGVQEEAVASTVAAGSSPVDLAASSPFMIQAESGDDAANRMHVSVLQRGEQHEAATIEPGTDKDNAAVTMVVEGQGEEDGEIASPIPASGAGALAELPETEPEPWVPKLVTSKNLPDHQEVQEEDAADEEWPVPLYSRPPDVLAHGKGGRLRRSATGGSKSAAADESEYWQLSDEELNRRVEDFITRFNRQMRLQIEQEAGV